MRQEKTAGAMFSSRLRQRHQRTTFAPMNAPRMTNLDPTVEKHLIDTPDGAMRVRILGSGPPVLCLHGVSAHGRSWMEVARRLTGEATFWMPDLLGRGESTPRPDLTYRMEDEARRVRELVAALRRLSAAHDPGFPAVIAGHSQGAAIAIAVAREEPAVRGLLLSNPVTPWTRRPIVLGALESGLIRRFAAGIFSPLRGPLASAILRRAAGPMFRVPTETVAAYARPYADRRRAETLMTLLRDWEPSELDAFGSGGRVSRVIAGAHDPRIAADAAKRLADELDAEFLLVEDGGHVLPEQHPDLVAEELWRILEEIGRGGGRSRAD
jgi:pimeloyl-ACP methyl ester carboxylesterase